MTESVLRLQLFVEGKRKKFKTTKPSVLLGNAKLCDIKIKLNSNRANFIEIKQQDSQIYLVDKYTEDGLYLDNVLVAKKKDILYQGQDIRIGKTHVDLKISIEESPDVIGKKYQTETDVSKLSQLTPDMITGLRNRENLSTQIKHQSQLKPQSQASIQFIHQSDLIQDPNSNIIQNLFETQAQELEDKVNNLKLEVKELHTEALKMKKNIRMHEYHCAEIKTKEELLKETNDELNNILKENEEKKHELYDEVSSLASQRDVALAELESSKLEKEYVAIELTTLKEELKALKDDHLRLNKELMDEYATKKEEALNYYDNKVKEATEYFDKKEQSFREDRRQIDEDVRQRLNECDATLQKKRDLFDEQIDKERFKVDREISALLENAHMEREKILSETHQEAEKIKNELNLIAETEAEELIKIAQDKKDMILESYRLEGLEIREEILKSTQDEVEKLESESILKMSDLSLESLEKARADEIKIINEAYENRDQILLTAEDSALEVQEQSARELEVFKSEIELLRDQETQQISIYIQTLKQEADLRCQETIEEAEVAAQKLHDEIVSQATDKVSKLESEEVELQKMIKRTREEFKKESQQRKSELDIEVQQRTSKLDHELAAKKMSAQERIEQLLNRAKRKENERIKSNIQTVSDNILGLIEQKVHQDKANYKGLMNFLELEEIKNIVSDSFNIDAPIHDEKLKPFILKNSNAKEQLKKFTRKSIIISVLTIGLGLTIVIRPSIFTELKTWSVNLVSLEKSAHDNLVESMKQARANRLKFNPIRDGKVRNTYTDSILYTALYRELVIKSDYRKKWTVELNLFILKELDLTEELLIKYLSLEHQLHGDLIEAFDSIYDEHKAKGLVRLKEIESEATPKLKAIFKTKKNWKAFLKFRAKFFNHYRDNY